MAYPRRSNRGIEENIMAILDSSASGVKEARDMDDDRLSFLEAVRSASIIAENGTAPTCKMFGAIFKMLKDGTSIELTMASYQLLCDLDKRFPRVYVANPAGELVVVSEAWSPFDFRSDSSRREEASSRDTYNTLGADGFLLLTRDITQAVNQMESWFLEETALRNILLFQYLVTTLEGDFSPRYTIYKETSNWAVLRESLLNTLLGSRRISLKSLLKDYIDILCGLNSRGNSSAKEVDDCDAAVAISAIELQKEMSISVGRFLKLIMELDETKKEADTHGFTSRADGMRTPLVDIIVDEITYNKVHLVPFLQAFSDPKWKLEIILQYFSKYITKPSVRTRRSENSLDDTSFGSMLKCLSNSTSVKSIVRRLSIEVVQFLLAHAFEAYLSVQHARNGTADSGTDIGSNSIVQICKEVISAFHNLMSTNKHAKIDSFAKGALFTAATVLSREY